MKPTSAILVVVVVAAAVAAVIALKPAPNRAPSTSASGGGPAPATTAAPAAPAATAPAAAVPSAPPRLLDLGAGACIPCKLMEPILDDLRKEYAGVLRVDFIDVRKDAAAGQAHGISSIPTQIFFAPDGKELFRHEGFLAKEDILARWRSLGYDLRPAPAATPPAGR